MNNMKNFLSSPKKTAILGLIGSLLMLLRLLINFSIPNVLSDLYIIGLFFYFLIVLARMYKKQCNIKNANYILICGYSITLLLMIVINLGFSFGIYTLSYTISFIISILYFFYIFLGKKNFVNNKVFAIVSIINTLIQTIYLIQFFIQNFSITLNMNYLVTFVSYISYMCIIPYFYNYYEILKEENENGK